MDRVEGDQETGEENEWIGWKGMETEDDRERRRTAPSAVRKQSSAALLVLTTTGAPTLPTQPGSERAKDFVRPPLDALPPPAEGAPTVPPLKRLRLRGPPTDPEGPRVSLGVPGMDELWNMWGDNTEMLAAEDRGHRRGLAGMVEDVASQMDPALGVPEKHRRKNSPDFKWAFLRCAMADAIRCHSSGRSIWWRRAT